MDISPVLPQIVSTFAVSKTHVGLSLTGMWLTYSLAQYPSEVLANRYGERRIILVTIGGSAIAGFDLSLTSILPLFFIATVLLGAVTGFHYRVATILLVRTHEKVGTAIGIHNSGATAVGLLTPWLSRGWQYDSIDGLLSLL
ncbi:MFS transporter [Halobacterium sp. KA-6]|uniref:MFS transporter n=1 Tax=Halobacterium sp. KA-6 TaxID=2896368 RepID=UPI003FA5C18E